jgi:hypothetical protein
MRIPAHPIPADVNVCTFAICLTVGPGCLALFAERTLRPSVVVRCQAVKFSILDQVGRNSADRLSATTLITTWFFVDFSGCCWQ